MDDVAAPAVLLVETDFLLRALWTIELQDSGYRVYLAVSAGGAEDTLRLHDEIVGAVVDGDAPGGYELVQLLRQRWPNVLTVAAYTLAEERPLPKGSVFLPKLNLSRDLIATLSRVHGRAS